MGTIKGLFLLLVLFNLIDVVLSMHILTHGGREQNPLVRKIIDHIGIIPGLALIKIAFLLAIWEIALHMSEAWAICMLGIATAMFMAVCVHNAKIVYRE